MLVLEADDVPGGAVRSGEVLGPGFTADLFSAFYPLGVASPVLRGLRLEEHGLRWSNAPAVLAHLFPDDRAVVLSYDFAATAASVESFAAGGCGLGSALHTDMPPDEPGSALFGWLLTMIGQRLGFPYLRAMRGCSKRH